jgi:hypothetical protein
MPGQPTQLDLAQAERIQPLRPLVVGDAQRDTARAIHVWRLALSFGPAGKRNVIG